MAFGRHARRHWHYEHHRDRLASRGVFLERLLVHAGIGIGLILAALLIGMIGYRATEAMSWLDAFLNASMILGGMGPVEVLQTTAGKMFAGMYALFAGMAFLVIAGIMIAPLAHRLLHRLHLEEDPDRQPFLPE